MPQAAKKDPVSSQRAQDKEAKRARGALSCAECRRLKLKCDKTVPCSSCKRRGCSAICPNGSLITGQGTRFVLADTEKLHAKIASMSDRIRQLEDALAISHSSSAGPSSSSSEPHPLLHRDLLQIKSSIDLHAAVDGEGPSTSGIAGKLPEGLSEMPEIEDEEQYIDAFGTLAIREDGAATFYGRSAGTESLLIGEAASPKVSEFSPQADSWSAGSSGGGFPPGISQLSRSFPFNPPPNSVFPEQTLVDLEAITTNYLPGWDEARSLTALYLEQAPWFFGAVTRRQIEEELLPMWYPEASAALEQQWVRPIPQAHPSSHLLSAAAAVPSPPGVAHTSSSTSTSSQPDNSPSPGSSQGRSSTQTPTSHDLALLFIIFTFGAQTDVSQPAAPDNLTAARFYELTKATLSLEGVLERPPSVATVQCLSLMAIYEGLCGGSSASSALLSNAGKKESEGNGGIESTWAIFGLATKLAQSIGLHRDCARWKLTPAEVQKRRALFWELFITDCWQSLATGRLATFSLPFVDCELPLDPDQTIAEDGSVMPSFPYWKARFGAECVSAVVQGTLTSRAPRYSIILELDRKVRDMELPPYALGPSPKGEGLSKTMSHFMPVNYRELTLLYIHRCFFAHALSSHPQDPIKSQYAPSFLAGYRSACTILGSIKQQFSLFPAQIARFWVLWTHAFSASVMLSSVVTHSARSKVAPAALLELRAATELFQQASSFGGRAVKFLPIIQRLQAKAHQTYLETNSGIAPAIPNDIFKPTARDDVKDELSIFSGKTHTVVTSKPSASSSSSSGSPRDQSGSPPSVNANYSPGQTQQQQHAHVQNLVAANPSFAGCHPSLVRELGGFEGQISQQIRNAYHQQQEQSNQDAAERAREMQAQMEMRERERQQEALRQQQEQQEYERQMQLQVEQQHRQEQYQRQQQQMEQQRLLQQHQRRPQHHQHHHGRTTSGRHPPEDRHHHPQEQRQYQPQQNVYPVVQQQSQGSEQQQPQYPPSQDTPMDTYPPSSSSSHQYDSHGHRLHSSSSQANLHQIVHQASKSSLRQVYHQPPNTQPMTSLPRKHSQPQLHQIQPTAYTPSSTSSYSPGMQTPVSATNTDFPESVYGGSQQSPTQPQPQQQQQQQQQYHTYQQQHHPQYQQRQHQSISPSEQNHPAQHPPQVNPGQPMQIDQQQYWASLNYANPAQPGDGRSQQHYQHYTPDGALRGIAADDRSLQETWAKYMTNVGSPRALFDK